MNLGSLKATPGARRKRKRVGRGPGSGLGKTSGKGHKGQKSRSGYSRPAGFEGGQMPLHRRLPKRGFRHRQRHACAVVNVGALEERFESGAEVTSARLVELGLAKTAPGGVKLLGRGELTKPLSVQVNDVTEGARKKIEAAGGTVAILGVPTRAGRRRGAVVREDV